MFLFLLLALVIEGRIRIINFEDDTANGFAWSSGTVATQPVAYSTTSTSNPSGGSYLFRSDYDKTTPLGNSTVNVYQTWSFLLGNGEIRFDIFGNGGRIGLVSGSTEVLTFNAPSGWKAGGWSAILLAPYVGTSVSLRISDTSTTGFVGVDNIEVPLFVSPTSYQGCTHLLASDTNTTSGLYTVQPAGLASLSVYCDMTTDGGGWLIIHSTGSTSLQLTSDTTSTSGDPRQFASYTFNLVTKAAIGTWARETLIRRDTGAWLSLSAPPVDANMPTASSTTQWPCTIKASDGTTISGWIGYSRFNNGNGGDFGITNSAGFDFSGGQGNGNAYLKNADCNTQPIYSLCTSNANKACYRAGMAVGNWTPTTSQCEKNENAFIITFNIAVRGRDNAVKIHFDKSTPYDMSLFGRTLTMTQGAIPWGVFDGSSYVTVPAASSLAFESSFTIVAQISPAQTAFTQMVLVAKGTTWTLSLEPKSSGTGWWVAFNSSAWTGSTEGSAVLVGNTAYTIAATWTGRYRSIYVNQALIFQDLNAPLTTSSSAIQVGGSATLPEYSGNMTSVLIYSRVLSLTEIGMLDFDACAAFPCTSPNTVCVDLLGVAPNTTAGRACLCNQGYFPNPTSANCAPELNVCDYFPCAANATCNNLGTTNSSAGRTCVCNTEAFSISKTLSATSSIATQDPFVTIGEAVTYRATITVPRRVASNGQLFVSLPVGQVFASSSYCAINLTQVNVTAGTPSTICSAALATLANGNRDMIFSFGSITNNIDGYGAITIDYTTYILNATTNIASLSLGHDSIWSWNAGSVLSSQAVVTIAEPSVSVSLTNDANSPDYGDRVTFTLTISTLLSNTDSFDLVLTGTPATGLVFIANSVNYVSGVNILSSTSTSSAISVQWATLSAGQSTTITFQAELTTIVSPELNINQPVSLTWTTLSGDVSAAQSTYSTFSTERLYRTSISSSFNVASFSLSKTVFSTSAAHTSGNFVAIGEAVTYLINVIVPEGQTQNLVLSWTLPSTQAFNSCSILADPGLTTNQSSWSSICSSVSVSNLARTLSFNIGNIGNIGVKNGPALSFQVFYTVFILNFGTSRGVSITDVASNFAWSSLKSKSVAGPSLTVVEPILSFSSVVLSPNTGDAFDSVTVLITILAGSSSNMVDAFDLIQTITIPGTFSLVSSSLQYVSGVSPSRLVEGTTITVEWGRLNVSQSSQIQFVVTAGSNLAPNQAITFAPGLSYTSLPGSFSTPQTGLNTQSTEKTTSTSTSRIFTVSSSTGNKVLVQTSSPSTAGQNIAVGESITYRVVVNIPEGVSTSTQMTFTLNSRLAYGSAVIATNGSVTSSISAISSIVPTVVGQTVTFNFGTVTNSDNNNAIQEVIVVEYTVYAINSTSLNTAGTTITDNSVTWSSSLSSIIIPALSSWVVVEPVLTFTNFAFTPNTGDYGDILTLNAIISQGATGTAAYDLVFSHVLPSFMTYVPNSLTVISGNALSANSTSSDSLTLQWSSVDPSSTVQLSFQVELTNTVTPELLITHYASLGWSSLAGDVSLSQSLFSTIATERVYSASASASITTKSIVLAKTLSSTSAAHTSGNDVAAGEAVTYLISIELPEGQADVLLTGLLPLNQVYNSCLITADAGISTSLSWTSICSSANVTNSGRQLSVNFGTLTNSVKNGAAQSVNFYYTVIILNVGALTRGVTISDTASTLSWQTGKSKSATASAVLSVVEPALSISISGSLANPDAGDDFIITGNISHTASSSSAALDAVFTQNLPSSLILVDGSLVTISGTTVTSYSVVDNQINVNWDNLPIGSSSVFSFAAKLTSSVNPLQIISTSSSLTWTSLPGPVVLPQSEYSPVSTERTGSASDPGGFINNYAGTSNSISTQVKTFSVNKSLRTPTSVSIGQDVTYRVEVIVPEGTSNSAQLSVDLASGLAFTSCSISGSVGLASSQGNWSQVCSGTSVNNSGRSLVFNFGTLVNSDSNNQVAEKLTIDYTAVVLNIEANRKGTTLTDLADTWSWGLGSVTVSAGSSVVVVEPHLEVSLSSSQSSGDAGDVLTLTATVNHIAASDSTAYDVVVSSVLPTGFGGVSGSVSVTSGSAVSWSSVTAGQVSFGWSSLSVGSSSVVQFLLKVDGLVEPKQQIAASVNLAWTSAAGDLSSSQSAYDTTSTERSGNTSAIGGLLNNYSANSSQISFLVDGPTLAKSVFSTSLNQTSDLFVAVGEAVTYRVVITIPEGKSSGVSLSSPLATGLAYGSCSIWSSDNFLSSNAGSFASICQNAVVETGGNQVTFNFGDLINSDDDNSIAQTIIVEYSVYILSIPVVVAGLELTDVPSTWTWSQSTESISTSDSLVVIDSFLEIDVSFSRNNLDVNDHFVVSLVVNHTATSNWVANDVVLSCAIPKSLLLDPSFAGSFSFDGNTLLFDVSSFQVGVGFSADFDLQVKSEVVASGFVAVGCSVTWSSLPGSFAIPQASSNTSSTERESTRSKSVDLSLRKAIIAKYQFDPIVYNQFLPQPNGPIVTGGTPLSFELLTPLPDALIFDSTTGNISGVPNVMTPTQNYAIAVHSVGGTYTYQLSLMVDYPLECLVSEWTSWSICTKTCESGSQYKSRNITQHSKDDKDCPPLIETRICNPEICPIHCVLSDWSDWSPCSVNCGNGTSTRTKSVLVRDAFGGQPCPTTLPSESVTCSLGACSSDYPVLLSARFAENGAFVALEFSANTNRGELPLSVFSSCASIIASATLTQLGSSPLCIWSSSKSLNVQLGGGATIALNQNFVLVANVIKSASGAVNVQPTQSPVLSPLNPPAVEAVVVGSSRVPLCGRVILDAGNSIGNLGRDFIYQWQRSQGVGIYALPPQDLGISERVLNTSASDLTEGVSYTYILTIKNFLGGVGTALYIVTITPANSPIITFSSPTSLVVSSTDAVSTKAAVVLDPNCAQSLDNYKYVWTQESGPTVILDNYMNTKSSTFYIPKNVLTAGEIYVFRITVTSAINAAASNYELLTIQVNPPPIKVQIGGSDRSVSMIGPVVITAQINSNNPNISYVWYVANSTDKTQVFVDADYSLLGVFEKDLTLPGLYFVANGVYSLKLVATLGDQISTSVLRVYPLLSKVLQIGISSPNNLEIFNPDSRLVLSVVALDNTTELSEIFEYLWTNPSHNLHLNPNNFATTTKSPNLVVYENVLQPGVEYTFQLQAWDKFGVTAVAAVKVLVNSPPTSGYCGPIPDQGIAYETEFTFRCNTWTDDHYPLTYAFAVVPVATGVGLTRPYVLLSDFQLARDVAVKLPGGDRVILAWIRDNYGAVATYNFTVQVDLPDYDLYGGPAAFANNLVDREFNSAFESGDLDRLGQTVILASDLLHSTRTASTISDNDRAQRASVREALNNGIGQFADENAPKSINSVRRFAELSAEVCITPDECTSDFRLQNLDLASRLFDTAVDLTSNAVPKSLATAVLTSLGNVGSSIQKDLQSSEINVTAESLAYANQFEPLTNGLASALVTSLQDGEANTVDSPYMKLLLKKIGDSSDTGSVSVTSKSGSVSTVSIPSTIAGQGSVFSVAQSFDMYTSAYQTNQSTSGQVVSVSLFDKNSNNIPVENLSEKDEIKIMLEHSALPENQTALCVYWNTTRNRWDTTGTKSVRVSPTRTECRVSHLTAFTINYRRFIPKFNTLSSSDFLALTPSNIREHPTPLIGIMVLFAIYLVLLPWAIRRDIKDSKEKVLVWYIAKWKETIKRDEHARRGFWKRVVDIIQAEHLWVSVVGRKFGEEVGSVARLNVILVASYMEMAINALFYGRAEANEAMFTISLISAVAVFIPHWLVFTLMESAGPPGPRHKFLEDVRQLQYEYDFQTDPKLAKKKKKQWGTPTRLPLWCKYLAYVLIVVLMLGSIILILTWGLQFDRLSSASHNRARSWVLSCVLATVSDITIVQPGKIILVTLIFYYMFGEKSEFDGITSDVVKMMEDQQGDLALLASASSRYSEDDEDIPWYKFWLHKHKSEVPELEEDVRLRAKVYQNVASLEAEMFQHQAAFQKAEDSHSRDSQDNNSPSDDEKLKKSDSKEHKRASSRFSFSLTRNKKESEKVKEAENEKDQKENNEPDKAKNIAENRSSRSSVSQLGKERESNDFIQRPSFIRPSQGGPLISEPVNGTLLEDNLDVDEGMGYVA